MATMFLNNVIANFAFAESFSAVVLDLIALVLYVVVRNIIIIRGIVYGEKNKAMGWK